MTIREGTQSEREPYGKDCVMFIVENPHEVGRGCFSILWDGTFFAHDIECKKGDNFALAMLFQRFTREARAMKKKIVFHVDRPGDLEPLVDSLIDQGKAKEQRIVIFDPS